MNHDLNDLIGLPYVAEEEWEDYVLGLISGERKAELDTLAQHWHYAEIVEMLREELGQEIPEADRIDVVAVMNRALDGEPGWGTSKMVSEIDAIGQAWEWFSEWTGLSENTLRSGSVRGARDVGPAAHRGSADLWPSIVRRIRDIRKLASETPEGIDELESGANEERLNGVALMRMLRTLKTKRLGDMQDAVLGLLMLLDELRRNG